MRARRASNQRVARQLVVLLVVLAVSSMVSSLVAGASDWPMFQRDVERMGFTDESLAPSEANCDWYYHQDGDRRFVHPSVANGHVYVSTYYGVVYCFDAYDGTVEWRRDLPGDVWDAGPAVYDGKVYIGTTAEALYCLNAGDGTITWTYTEPMGDIDGSPVVADDMVIFGDLHGFVHCVNAQDGTKIWKFWAGGDFHGGAAVDLEARHVYIGTGGNDRGFYCLPLDDPTPGDQQITEEEYIWKYDVYTNSTPVLLDDFVIMCTHDGILTCIEKEDDGDRVIEAHEIRWPTDLGSSGTSSSPALAYGNVYIGTYDGNLHKVAVSDGDIVWSFQTDGNISSSPAIADQKVYFVSSSPDNHLYCLEAGGSAPPTVVWSDDYETGDYVNSSPAIAYNRLYVGADRPVDGGDLVVYSTDRWVGECPQVAVCCISGNVCELMIETVCLQAGGVWTPTYTACDPDLCDPLSGVDDEATRITKTELQYAQPNPFRGNTDIYFQLSSETSVSLSIFDAAGRRVRTLLEDELAAGSHQIVWDGMDDQGRRLSTGAYWCRLAAADRNLSTKLIMLR